MPLAEHAAVARIDEGACTQRLADLVARVVREDQRGVRDRWRHRHHAEQDLARVVQRPSGYLEIEQWLEQPQQQVRPRIVSVGVAEKKVVHGLALGLLQHVLAQNLTEQVARLFAAAGEDTEGIPLEHHGRRPRMLEGGAERRAACPALHGVRGILLVSVPLRVTRSP